MPFLSELATRAVLFEDAYAVYPESIKGLFSVLCSTSPAFDTSPEEHGKADVPSLAEALQAAGFRCGLFHSGRFAYLGMEAIVQALGFETLEDAGHIGGNFESSFGVDEPTAVKRILSWIDAVPRGERFFVAYLPIAGHHPYATPVKGPYPERELIGCYRNALHYGDASLRELFLGFRGRGLERETVFFFLGDHGEAFDQHAGNSGHTFFVYEENVRVPFLIVAPGVIETPQRVRRTASLLDTAPTILDLLGVPAPAAWQGRSLLDPEPRLALFFTDYSLGFLGLRDGCFKLIHEVETGRSRLYDLCKDPGETEDIASRHPERASAYAGRLKAWSAAQREHVRGLGNGRRH